jgi:aminoglycoside phosphotransferase
MPATDSADALGRLWRDVRAALIRDGIDPEGPDGPRARVTDASLIRTHPAGYSVLFLVSASVAGRSAPLRLYAKVRRGERFGAFSVGPHSEHAARLARLEYDELVRTHRFFSAADCGLGVVRPVGHMEGLPALLVTEAEGTDLSHLSRRDPDGGARALALAGRWLRLYHQGVHQTSERERPAEETRRDACSRADRLAARGVPRRTLGPMLERLGAAADAIGAARVPCAVTHGDFKLRHVYSRDERIQVLDFGNVGSGDCYRDVAAMLVELAVLPLGSFGFATAPVERLSSAFLGGYFAGTPPPTLALYIASALLKKWERRLVRWSPSGSGRAAQRVLEGVGAKRAVDRAHVDPWFQGRIKRVLASTCAATT